MIPISSKITNFSLYLSIQKQPRWKKRSLVKNGQWKKNCENQKWHLKNGCDVKLIAKILIIAVYSRCIWCQFLMKLATQIVVINFFCNQPTTSAISWPPPLILKLFPHCPFLTGSNLFMAGLFLSRSKIQICNSHKKGQILVNQMIPRNKKFKALLLYKTFPM